MLNDGFCDSLSLTSFTTEAPLPCSTPLRFERENLRRFTELKEKEDSVCP